MHYGRSNILFQLTQQPVIRHNIVMLRLIKLIASSLFDCFINICCLLTDLAFLRIIYLNDLQILQIKKFIMYLESVLKLRFLPTTEQKHFVNFTSYKRVLFNFSTVGTQQYCFDRCAVHNIQNINTQNLQMYPNYFYDELILSFMREYPYFHPYYRRFPYSYCPFDINHPSTDKQLKPTSSSIGAQKHDNLSAPIGGLTNVRLISEYAEPKKPPITKKKNNQVDSKSKKAVQLKKPNQTNIKYRPLYFDPSSVPLITSFKKHLVEKENGQIKSPDDLDQDVDVEQRNQILYPQSDSDPFILYKHRKEKRKYKRFKKRVNAESSEYSISELGQYSYSEINPSDLQNLQIDE